MKHCSVSLLMALVALAGCKSGPHGASSEASDGFYIESKKFTGVVVRMPHPADGRILTFQVEPFEGFIPTRVAVFDTPDGSHVQISGNAAVEGWSEQLFMLVANQKPYLELGKAGQAVAATKLRVGPSATVSLDTSTHAEADAVASAIRQRYSISQ